MELSVETIQNLLGIKGYIPLTLREMAKNLTVTFFPFSECSKRVNSFAKRLKVVMEKIGVKVLPYKDALAVTKGKEKIKKGIVTIILGEGEEGNLPIDHTETSTDNPIVTIIDVPREIDENLSYEEHMEIGLNLFSWHVCNIVICVSDNYWIVYSFNGFSPFHRVEGDFENDVLNNVIPKIATRVSPLRITEFEIKRTKCEFIDNAQTQPYVEDLVESGQLLAQTDFFGSLRKVEEFKYRNDFYKAVVSFHLDERKGMSYGFIARQLPLKFKKLIPFKKVKKGMKFKNKDFLVKENKSYVLIKIKKDTFVLEVPPVWVLMSRSGSDKTRLNPYKDILKIGLENGKMVMEIPPFIEITKNYKPSFDTRLILSHCLANAIYGNVLKAIKKDALFPRMLENNGLAIAHWHGNLLPEFIPRGWYIYGKENPPVLCSSSQSAIYAFKEKGRVIEQSLLSDIEYLGDLHIEPQHGINITWETLKGLSYYLLSNSFISKPDKGNFLK